MSERIYTSKSIASTHFFPNRFKRDSRDQFTRDKYDPNDVNKKREKYFPESDFEPGVWPTTLKDLAGMSLEPTDLTPVEKKKQFSDVVKYNESGGKIPIWQNLASEITLSAIGGINPIIFTHKNKIYVFGPFTFIQTKGKEQKSITQMEIIEITMKNDDEPDDCTKPLNFVQLEKRCKWETMKRFTCIESDETTADLALNYTFCFSKVGSIPEENTEDDFAFLGFLQNVEGTMDDSDLDSVQRRFVFLKLNLTTGRAEKLYGDDDTQPMSWSNTVDGEEGYVIGGLIGQKYHIFTDDGLWIFDTEKEVWLTEEPIVMEKMFQQKNLITFPVSTGTSLIAVDRNFHLWQFLEDATEWELFKPKMAKTLKDGFIAKDFDGMIEASYFNHEIYLKRGSDGKLICCQLAFNTWCEKEALGLVPRSIYGALFTSTIYNGYWLSIYLDNLGFQPATFAKDGINWNNFKIAKIDLKERTIGTNFLVNRKLSRENPDFFFTSPRNRNVKIPVHYSLLKQRTGYFSVVDYNNEDPTHSFQKANLEAVSTMVDYLYEDNFDLEQLKPEIVFGLLNVSDTLGIPDLLDLMVRKFELDVVDEKKRMAYLWAFCDHEQELTTKWKEAILKTIIVSFVGKPHTYPFGTYLQIYQKMALKEHDIPQLKWLLDLFQRQIELKMKERNLLLVHFNSVLRVQKPVRQVEIWKDHLRTNIRFFENERKDWIGYAQYQSQWSPEVREWLSYPNSPF